MNNPKTFLGLKPSVWKSLQLPALLVGVMILASADVFAQNANVNPNAGAAAIGAAVQPVKAYIEPVKAIIYAIAGILALGGAFNIYIKMQNDDQDVKKTIAMVIGGCLMLIILAEALPKFFGF